MSESNIKLNNHHFFIYIGILLKIIIPYKDSKNALATDIAYA